MRLVPIFRTCSNVVQNELPYLMDEMQQSGFGDFTQTWKVS